MECTWTINQTNMMNGLKKNRGWEKPKKMVGPREQRMVEIQLEIVEVEKTHSVLTNAVIIVNWFWNVPGWHNKNDWNIQQFKLGCQDKAQSTKWSQMIYHIICFPLFSSSYGPKITRPNKIYISTKKSSLSEGNLSPIWKNTLVHLVLDVMADSPMFFTMLSNIISSNTSPHILVPF